MLEKQKSVDGDAVITTVLFDNDYDLLHERINIKVIHPSVKKNIRLDMNLVGNIPSND